MPATTFTAIHADEVERARRAQAHGGVCRLDCGDCPAAGDARVKEVNPEWTGRIEMVNYWSSTAGNAGCAAAPRAVPVSGRQYFPARYAVTPLVCRSVNSASQFVCVFFVRDDGHG
jgi:hypothetical protein